jgi:hypothetical protein
MPKFGPKKKSITTKSVTRTIKVGVYPINELYVCLKELMLEIIELERLCTV